MRELRWNRGVRLVLGWWVAVLLTGCATQQTNWNHRVGHYTFDQAVLEFGPPDKSSVLTDGTKVAEWLRRRGCDYYYAPFAWSYSPCGYGPYYGAAVWSATPDSYLRLTFAPDGLLQNWKRFYK